MNKEDPQHWIALLFLSTFCFLSRVVQLNFNSVFSIPAPQLDSSDVDLVSILNTSSETQPANSDLFIIG
jgi:hypothetical protein